MRPLELGGVVSHIGSMCASEPVEDVLSVDSRDLRDLYTLFSDLDRVRNVDTAVYQTLRNLPIWLSSKGLIRATHALLPGNFTDPTGAADLLDVTVLTDAARAFVSSRLGVPTQTIETFVQTVLPGFSTMMVRVTRTSILGTLQSCQPPAVSQRRQYSALVGCSPDGAEPRMDAGLGLPIPTGAPKHWSRSLGRPRIYRWMAVESPIPDRSAAFLIASVYSEASRTASRREDALHRQDLSSDRGCETCQRRGLLCPVRQLRSAKDRRPFRRPSSTSVAQTVFPLKGIASSGMPPHRSTPLTGRRLSNLRRTFSISGIRDG